MAPGKETSEGKLAGAAIYFLSGILAVLVYFGITDEQGSQFLLDQGTEIINAIALIVSAYVGGRSGLKIASQFKKPE